VATVWRDMRTRGRPVWCIMYKGLDLKWHRERTEAQTRIRRSVFSGSAR